MLFLQLQRRVRQKSCKSEIPVEGGVTDVDVSICTPGRVVVARVNDDISVGGARVTVLDLSVPVASRGGGIGRDYFVGVM